MQLRNKILLIFAVIVAFFTIPSFASSSNEFEYNGIIFTDECFTYPYITIFLSTDANKPFDDTYYNLNVVYSNDEFKAYYDESVPDAIIFEKGNSGFYRKTFNVNNGVVTLKYSSNALGYITSNTFVVTSSEDLKDVCLLSDIDICDSDGNVVFQAPPNLERATRKAQIVAGVVTQETLTKELAELVPVGVTILATMILVSLVAYFPHWKA